jgi:hypothetical protein
MFKRIAGVIAGSTAMLAVAVAGPAFGATKVVADDAGDAKARFDITSVTFNNGTQRFAAKAHVPDLRLGGEQYYSLTISPRNSPDIFFTAFGKLHRDNTITDRLTVFNDIGEVSRVPCAGVRSIWSPEGEFVKISLPRTCLGGVSGRMWMTANLGPSAKRASQDHVIGRFVRAG